jgi:small subunit ribosomal protein S17
MAEEEQQDVEQTEADATPEPEPAEEASEAQGADETPEPQAADEAPEPQAAEEAPEPQAAEEAPEPQAAAEETEVAAPEPEEAPQAEAAEVAEAEAAAEQPVAAPPAEAAERVRPKKKRLPRSQRRSRPRAKREKPAERRPIVRLPKPEREPGRRQERRGVVVSSAMDKTIVVQVETVKAHPRYKKVVRRSRRFHAHDAENVAKVGDVVRIVESRPLSKLKTWRLAEVVEQAR